MQITYSDEKVPITSVQDAIKASSFITDQIQNMTAGDPDGAMASSAHVITGEIALGTQHHFHMETHVGERLIACLFIYFFVSLFVVVLV